MPATLTLHSAVDAYTTTGPEDLEVSRTVRALEQAWHAVSCTVAGGLPEVAIVVASGHEGHKVKHHGAYGPARWVASCSDGGLRGEVVIAAERLADGPVAILGTLIHEAAHALANARGIQDTSRQGRYHNTAYKRLAEELGLIVEKHETYGWTLTRMSDETVTRFGETLDALEGSVVGYRTLPAPVAGPPAGTGGDPDPEPTEALSKPAGRLLIVCSCAKPRKLRVSSTTLAEGPISCGACGCDFAPER